MIDGHFTHQRPVHVHHIDSLLFTWKYFCVCPGLQPSVFAALVPNSADKLLGEVIEEIMGDHEMLVCYWSYFLSVYIFIYFMFPYISDYCSQVIKVDPPWTLH